MLKKIMYLMSSLMLLIQLLSAIPAQAEDTFCWKGSYGRGVGKIPEYCTDPDRPEKQAGMCYKSCPSGYEGAVTMCLKYCPSGYINMGTLCHIDKALLVPAKINVCNMSSDCPSGYVNAGLMCGLKTPEVPDGFSGLTGLDIIRPSTDRGIGNAPTGCANIQEYDFGLCYDKCKTNYDGVGPVCWNTTCPSGWTNCGASCAKTQGDCVSTIVGQVAAVAGAVKDIASLVGTAGASTGLAAAENATKLQEAIAKVKALKDQYKKQIAAAKMVKDGVEITKASYEYIDAITNPQVSNEELARVILELYALLDPTGLTSAAASFVYPICADIK